MKKRKAMLAVMLAGVMMASQFGCTSQKTVGTPASYAASGETSGSSGEAT